MTICHHKNDQQTKEVKNGLDLYQMKTLSYTQINVCVHVYVFLTKSVFLA